jgi:hypothetical protein
MTIEQPMGREAKKGRQVEQDPCSPSQEQAISDGGQREYPGIRIQSGGYTDYGIQFEPGMALSAFSPDLEKMTREEKAGVAAWNVLRNVIALARTCRRKIRAPFVRAKDTDSTPA